MPTRTVLISVPDLFFSTRITTTASQLGVMVESCAPGELAQQLKSGAFDLAIVDLHAAGILEAVRALRADAATRELLVVGFYSHVDQALRQAALASGVSEVLPRSAFTVRLPDLLVG